MKFVAAILYAVSGASLAGLGFGYAAGGLNVLGAWMALMMGALAGAAALWQSRAEPAFPWARPGAWGWAAIALFTLFSLRTFLWLIFRHRDGILVLSPNNLGDMSLHLGYIRLLAGGGAFWPENPIYAGAPLTYPLGMDLFNSLLLLAGVDLFRGLVWVGLAGALLTGLALWNWGRAFVLAGFLCNGGMLGLHFFDRLEVADFQSEAAWKSIPLALFATQRGLLFALPAGLILLAGWRGRLFREPGEAPAGWHPPLWGEVMLYASLPLFHLHTFLFLSFVLGLWFAFCPRTRRPVAVLVGASLLPATLLVLLVTGMFKGASVLGWKPGWMQEEEPVFLFWFKNFGFLPVLIAALVVRLGMNRNARWPRAMVFPSLLVFLVCCFVKFAPWEWDNTKLMIWSYLGVLPFLWSELLARLRPPGRIIGCGLLFFSGFLSLLGGLDSTHRGFELARRSELDAVEFALRALPFGERFAAAPAYNHPLLLAGRKVAMGYEGHVWSHGYDWASRKAQLDILMNGEPGWRQIARQLRCRYLFWGPMETEAFPHSAQPWKTEARLLDQGEWGAIYELGH